MNAKIATTLETAACFSAGTLVHTNDGLKPIEDIKVGDLVLSYPDDLVPPRRAFAPFRLESEYYYKPVTKTFVHEDAEVLELRYAQSGWGEWKLRVTPNHPFYADDRGWVQAKDLKILDRFRDETFANMLCGGVKPVAKRERVYNIEVEEFHTYFVGEQGAWVHNKGNTPVIKGGQAQTKELGCFVAGTLVHTREGLRPVEQIQVGDYVLSKPESGAGEASYQPVTKTFSYEDREVYRVDMTEIDPTTGDPLNGRTEYIAATGAHPVWVQRFEQLNWGTDEIVVTAVNGWVSVEEIYLKNWHAYWHGPSTQLASPDTYVLLANGAPAIMRSPDPILRGPLPNEGVLFNDSDTWLEDGCVGRRLLFSPNGIESIRGTVALGNAKNAGYDYSGYDMLSATSVVKLSGGHLPIRRTVYNLEVAHNHSYFVGELGLWVHDAQ